MKIEILILFGALTLFGLSTCTENPATVSDKTLVDSEWDLQSFEVISVGESDIGSEGILLIFKEDSTFEGRSSNNSYHGTYKVSANYSIFISVPVTTKVNSPPGSRYGEYLGALKNAHEFQIKGDRLRIFYEGKTKALNFKAE